jgi:hypothetical protein
MVLKKCILMKGKLELTSKSSMCEGVLCVCNNNNNKSAIEFLNSYEKRPDMKKSHLVSLSDNTYFTTLGKASVDNPVVTPEKVCISTAAETFLNSIMTGASEVRNLLSFKEHPNKEAFLKRCKKPTCAEIKLLVHTFLYKGRTFC